MNSARSKIALITALLGFALLSHVLSGGAEPQIPALNSYYYDILIGIGINIILAASLNLVNGYTGQFSLGHAGFMAVGAYLGSALALAIKFPYFSLPTWGHVSLWWILKLLWLLLAVVANAIANAHNLIVSGTQFLPSWGQFIVALFYGGTVAALAGLAVGVPSLRLKGDYLAIVTLGFNEIIKGVIQNAEPLGAQRGLGGMVQYTTFFWTFAFAAVTVYVVVNLVNSTYGRGFLAVRDDEIAAEAMGINTTKYKVLAFVIGAFFAGLAGGLYAHFKQFVHPEGFNFLRSVDIVVMVILGGMGSTAGVCVAAALLTILPEFLRWFAKSDVLNKAIAFLYQAMTPEHFAVASQKTKELFENRMILYSLLLIVLMLTRPQGLFGQWSGKRNQQK